MAAPKKVKDMANLADRLIAQRADPTTPPGGPVAPVDTPPELAVVVDPPVTDKPPQLENPYAIDPATLAAIPTVRPAAAPAAAAPKPEGWEHKYNVLKGMMDRAKTDSNDRILQLENQIEVLTKMARQPGPQETFHSTETPTMSDYGISDEDIEALGGQEFIDQILKISAAGAATEIAELRGEVDSLRNSQTESNEDLFYTQLSTLSPQWRAINKDDRFNEWLLEDEGLSGIPKKSFLENAYENRDADTSARYFNEFLKLLPGSPDLQPAITEEILPDASAGGGGPAVMPSDNIYTPQSINAFYKDKGLGKFKGREAEAEAIEKDIFAAQQEGRIVRRRIAPRPG